jgi:hypothetical protein
MVRPNSELGDGGRPESPESAGRHRPPPFARPKVRWPVSFQIIRLCSKSQIRSQFPTLQLQGAC